MGDRPWPRLIVLCDKNWVRSGAIPFAIVVALSGCQSTAPIEESKTFAEAADAVSDAGALLLDSLSVAERQRRAALFSFDVAKKYDFDVDDAAYFATIGDPPSASSFRHSLAVVTSYADLLVSLVEAKDVASTKSDLVEISMNLSGMVGFAAGAAATQALSPVIERALRSSSLSEARRLVLQGAPAIDALLEAIKDATPEIFSALIYEDRKEPSSGKDGVARLAAQRTRVANFVVLLDRLKDTFSLLRAAFEYPRASVALNELRVQTAQLRADVEAARKFMAER